MRHALPSAEREYRDAIAALVHAADAAGIDVRQVAADVEDAVGVPHMVNEYDSESVAVD